MELAVKGILLVGDGFWFGKRLYDQTVLSGMGRHEP